MKPDRAISQDGLRAALRGGSLTMAWFSMGSVPLLETGARQGFDAAVIDLQHGLWDRMQTHLAVGSVGPLPIIVRVADAGAHAIGEGLDSGACGILVPLVETAEQARLAVAAARYPARGFRSGGGVRPLAQGFGRYVEQNADPIVGIMIETLSGVANAAEIASVPGVDFVFLGTGDLALSIGCFPEIDDRHEAACQRVLTACRDAGMPCGIFTNNAAAARFRLEEGFAVVVAANDVDVIVGGFAAASTEAQPAVHAS